MEFAPNGGRPCNGAFPYYRIMFEDCGLSMAIGWPDSGRRVSKGSQMAYTFGQARKRQTYGLCRVKASARRECPSSPGPVTFQEG